VQVDAQRTLNLYPQVEKANAKTPLALYCPPGLQLVTTIGNGPHRSNGVEFQSRMYVVSGGQLLSFDRNEAVVTIGSLSTVEGRCSIVAGRDYVMAVDGTAGYTWDGTTFAAISDGDFPDGATHVTYLDGYFIVNSPGSDEVYVSALEDPTAWAALDFTVAEANPDDVLAVAANHKDLYLIGSVTTEVYYNSGNADFPFDPYANGALEWGIQAPASLAEADGRFFWLARTRGGGGVAIMVDGFAGQVISTPAHNWQFGELDTITDAVGFAYKLRGGTFYELTFPAAGKTYVFHVEQGMWHESGSHGIGRHRANTHGFFDNRHFAGDYLNGNLYELDYATYTDNGDPIERLRRTAVVHRDRRRLHIHEIEVECEAGVGLTSGQGSDPQIMLRYSKDGGKTWSSELWRPLGKKGQYAQRAVWRQLGIARQFVFEIVVTDPVELTIINGYLDIEVLSA